VPLKDALKEIDVRETTDGRMAFLFPRWALVALALLVMGGVGVNTLGVKTLKDLRAQDSAALNSLARSVQRLERDAIRTRALLETKWPETARRIDEVLRDEEDEGS
jgi:hypothetical protein